MPASALNLKNQKKMIKTKFQLEKERQEDLLLHDYLELTVDGNSRVEVNKILMKKYNIHAMSTIYAMVRRAKKRRQDA